MGNKRQNKQPRTRRIIVRNSVPPHPPQFKATASFRKTVRFVAKAATTDVITAANLLDLHFVAATNILGYRIIDAIKVHRIQLWAPMPSSLVPTTTSVEWYGQIGAVTATGSSSQIFSDTSMGADRCAYVNSKPPKQSQADFWQSFDSVNPLFQIVCPLNTIIDLECTFVLNDDETVQALQNPALVAAAAATLYMGGLDGKRLAASNYTPVSWAQA